MQFNLLGTNNDIFSAAFFDEFGTLDSTDFISATATQAVLQNSATGVITTVSGTGIVLDSNNNPSDGTITGFSFSQAGSVQATLYGLNWGAVAFLNALVAIENTGDFAPIAALFNGAGPFTIDASAAGINLNMYFLLGGTADLLTQPFTVIGSNFGDVIVGGSGNDSLNAGANNYVVDDIYASGGNDTIDFSGASPESFFSMGYDYYDNGAFTFNVNGAANTGSIQKPGSTDTLIDVRHALQADGIRFVGGVGNDTFNLSAGADGWFSALGNRGNDTFNLTLDGNGARLEFGYPWGTPPTAGLVMNLVTGVVSNDGFGNTDQINILGGESYLEILATNNNDSILGSDRDESFILLAGNDTLDGGGGYDRLRYNRGDFGPVSVDLLAGTASGTFEGNAFTHLLSNIEIVWGSNHNDDTLSGSYSRDKLDGWGGNDLIDGRGGDDLIFGGEGNDTLRGGDGNDWIEGYRDNDLIFGGANFDTIYGGDGNDTVAGDDGRDLVYLNQGNDLYNDNAQGGELGRDTVFAGYGDDTIQGGNGDDAFYGEWGNDLIFARLGNDRVFGGDGFDTIWGGDGNDTVDGGNGRDLIYLDAGNDVFNDNAQGGDLGRDTVFAGDGDDTIQGGNGDDVFYGEQGNDAIYARLGNDTVYAGDNFDFVDAGDGNDLVFAGNGRDRVFLGNGDDVYVDTAQGGALGQDTITGGAGADRFEFQAVISADVITDFQIGIDDLQLTQSLWGGGRTAAQVVSDFASVTANGVLLNFGVEQSILLQGLTSTAGLAGDLILV